MYNGDPIDHVYISGGVHLNFFGTVGYARTPINVHVDKLLLEKHMWGAGYSYEQYERAPSLQQMLNLGTIRHNLRLRYSYYYTNATNVVSQYIGLSVGVSMWTYKNLEDVNHYAPTGQFFYGMKFRIWSPVFANIEFAIGPPYAMRLALGYRF